MIADIQKKLQATEMRYFRKLLSISYKDHITNDTVKQVIGPYDDILTTIKKRKVKRFGHVLRLVGNCGERWENCISDWTGLRFCDP